MKLPRQPVRPERVATNGSTRTTGASRNPLHLATDGSEGGRAARVTACATNGSASLRALLIFAIICGAAAVAFGAEHGEHEGPSLATSLFLPLLNFAGFVFLFHWYAWPAIRGALSERRRAVEKELREAAAAESEAAAMLGEVEARRARVKDEGERLVRELRAEAEADQTRLLKAARQSAERIRADARLFAEQEAARAAHRIREDVADQVVAQVAAALRERVTAEDQARFVGRFAAAVETGELR